MHPISWQLKRAHLSAVAAGTGLLSSVPDMTPARFDILFLIHKVRRYERSFGYAADQVALTQRLGLSRATVSKMLKRLEQLGLVTKERCHNDGRRNLVRLTQEGIKRFRMALDLVFNGKTLFRAYTSLLGNRRWSRRTRWRLQHFLAGIYDCLYDIAQLFGDTSHRVYELNYEIDH
jgi:DNA-binding MarR family transcriptional regulator